MILVQCPFNCSRNQNGISFLYQYSINEEFERYKEDTVARVYTSGLVVWLTPAIYTSSCLIRVRYFPFDTQVCTMKFGSWGLTGAEVDIFPEESIDATQDR